MVAQKTLNAQWKNAPDKFVRRRRSIYRSSSWIALDWLPSSNQTWQWKIHHEGMIYPLRPPFTWNFPLPCLMTFKFFFGTRRSTEQKSDGDRQESRDESIIIHPIYESSSWPSLDMCFFRTFSHLVHGGNLKQVILSEHFRIVASMLQCCLLVMLFIRIKASWGYYM